MQFLPLVKAVECDECGIFFVGKIMKIGILTLPLHTNYGGILQAYALQTVLERMGLEVDVLNRSQRRTLPSKWPIVFLKRLIKKYIMRKKIMVFAEIYHNRYYPELSKYTQPFIDAHINQRLLKSLNEIQEFDYDAIVVGSDQIWSPNCFRNMWGAGMEMAFLGFSKRWNVGRVAYAASFGNDMWSFSQEETEKCKKLVAAFWGVSVREKSGMELCQSYLDTFAELVPDPTLLLDKDDYIRLIEKKDIKKSTGNLLCYVLDDSNEKRELVKKIAKDRNLVPFKVNSKIEDIFAPVSERVQPPVEQWLQGFCDAEFVVTDSFHACVFSVIFGKPFIVYGNKARGLTRFKSLLSILEIEENLITSLSEYSSVRGGKMASKDVVASFKERGMFFLKTRLVNNA